MPRARKPLPHGRFSERRKRRPVIADIPPPNIVASGAQAGYAQVEAAKARDKARNDQTRSAERNAKAIDDAGAVIETEDGDTAVFADAEGAGGQGRHTEEGEHEPESEDTPKKTDVTTDTDGQQHLDIQA